MGLIDEHFRQIYGSKLNFTYPVSTSTAIRADFVGGFDMPSMRRLDLKIIPLSAGLSLKIGGKGAEVTISSLPSQEDGVILLSVQQYDGSLSKITLPLSGFDVTNNQWEIFLSILASFPQEKGFSVEVNTSWPPQSGLGGSGAIRAALIKAFLIACKRIAPSAEEIVKWSSRIDQIFTRDPDPSDVYFAVAHSRVAVWGYNGDVISTPIPKDFVSSLSHKLVLLCTDEPRNSHKQDDIFVNNYLQGKNWHMWLKLGENSKRLCEALLDMDIKDVIVLLNKQNDLLSSLSPGFSTPTTERIRDYCIGKGTGFKVLGAGGGGCCMVLAPTNEIATDIKDYYECDDRIKVLKFDLLSS